MTSILLMMQMESFSSSVDWYHTPRGNTSLDAPRPPETLHTPQSHSDAERHRPGSHAERGSHQPARGSDTGDGRAGIGERQLWVQTV